MTSKTSLSLWKRRQLTEFLRQHPKATASELHTLWLRRMETEASPSKPVKAERDAT
jgi:ribosomal 50S subunit-associated protein YjgA (DUF615 family)